MEHQLCGCFLPWLCCLAHRLSITVSILSWDRFSSSVPSIGTLHPSFLKGSCITPMSQTKQHDPWLVFSWFWWDIGARKGPTGLPCREKPYINQTSHHTLFLPPLFRIYGILLMNWARQLQRTTFLFSPFGAVERADGNRYNKILIKCQAIICSE